IVMLAGLLVLAMGAWLTAAEKSAPKPGGEKAAPKAGESSAPKVTEEPDEGIQGLYLSQDGASAKVFGQGGGAFKVVLTPAGGAAVELTGKLEGGKVALKGAGGESGTVGDKKLSAAVGDKKFELAYTAVKPPTLGEKPPAGASILLPFEEGKKTSLEAWNPPSWTVLDDGSIQVSKGDLFTKQEFGDIKLHLEFRLPYEPAGRGQGRGNSGVYLMDRYEIQVLDSFGLEPKNNDCAAVYTQVAPKVNACLPPGQWQTYDITFHAPRFDAEGKKTKDAVVTVVQNGVTVQDQTVIKSPTGSAKSKPEVKKATFHLQDHQHKVQYRNIWLVELKD
ncbi:MAG: DUF1080 domain-containing protein, partial [Planctomycetota bacterium]|nr:DUF1080 domain-containing protein [Planctomycetota bacterium]